MPSVNRTLSVCLGLTFCVFAAQAAGTVTVSFVEPEKFADARDARLDSSDNLRVLAGHIESAASRYMADGQKLSVEVLDVDLAGEVRPSRRFHQDVRVLKGGADWPRVTLRYTLESPGQPVRRVEQTISDMAYLQRSNGLAYRDALSHEKRMLDEWFKGQFAAVN